MKHRLIAGIALAATATLAPGVAWASGTPAAPTTTAPATKPSSPSTPAPNTSKSSTSSKTTGATSKKTSTRSKKTSTTYTVYNGTFHSKANAEARLAKISKKGISGLSVVEIGKKTKRYRVEEQGLSKTDAVALSKKLASDGFSHHIIKG